MADAEYLRILKQGVKVFNEWRVKNSNIKPNLLQAELHKENLSKAYLSRANLIKANLSEAKLMKAELLEANLSWANLSGADLSEANLSGADLSGADLSGADLSEANLSGADLSWANLSEATLYRAYLYGTYLYKANLIKAKLVKANLRKAKLSGADLRYADLPKADLSEADLSEADLSGTNFRGANLNEADLSRANLYEANISKATLLGTNLDRANLTNCRVYGTSTWDLVLDNTTQTGLIITNLGDPVITVDDIEVAQLIYLLLNRKKLRNVLDTITSKAVLILGRFTPERKAVLDAMAVELRRHNLLPIIFDFERSTKRDFTETIKILAGLSLFVIVDLTKPRSAPQELTATVPDYQIPFVPILEEGQDSYSMFEDLMKYDWVLKPLVKYRTKEELLSNFKNVILERAWIKHLELQRKKNKALEVISIDEMAARSRDVTD